MMLSLLQRNARGETDLKQVTDSSMNKGKTLTAKALITVSRGTVQRYLVKRSLKTSRQKLPEKLQQLGTMEVLV